MKDESEADVWKDFIFQRDAAATSMSLPEEGGGGMMAMMGAPPPEYTNDIYILRGMHFTQPATKCRVLG